MEPRERSRDPGETARTRSDRAAARSARAIFVADDDPDDLFLLRRRLEKAGITNPVMSFRDGEEIVDFLLALAAKAGDGVQSLRPLVIFLDIKMPRLDGFEVLRWLRRQRALRDIPVIMLSGSDEPRDIRRATELGATDFLVKHPSPETFARVLAAACDGT